MLPLSCVVTTYITSVAITIAITIAVPITIPIAIAAKPVIEQGNASWFDSIKDDAHIVKFLFSFQTFYQAQKKGGRYSMPYYKNGYSGVLG